MPEAFTPRSGEWLLVPLYHLFGSEPLSLETPGIAEQAPNPYVAIGPDDCRGLGAEQGDTLAVEIGRAGASSPGEDHDRTGARVRRRSERPSRSPGARAPAMGEAHEAAMNSILGPLINIVTVLGIMLTLGGVPDLVRATSAGSLAGPLRSQPGRTIRAAAGRRRHDQDLLQGGLDSAFRGPVRLRACPGGDHDRGADVLRRGAPEPRDLGGRSERRTSLHPRHVVDDGLRLGPRRMGLQQQVRACSAGCGPQRRW